MSPLDRLREAMADRQTGRLVHRASGVTIHLFDGAIIAADGLDDAEAVIATLRADPLVQRFKIDHAASRIESGAEWLPALNAAIEAPPLEAALVERFKQNLARFVAAQGSLDVERGRTGIPINLQQGVDTTEIVGEPLPRPRDATKLSMTPPPVPRSLRGATPRILPAAPMAPTVVRQTTPVAAPSRGISPTTVALIVLPLALLVVFIGSLLLNLFNSPRARSAPVDPPIAPVDVAPPVEPLPVEPPPIAPVEPPPIEPPPVEPPPVEPPPVEPPPVEPPPVKPPPVKPPPVKPPPVADLPASTFLGEWRGTVSGRTSAVVVQVADGRALNGVFWTSDDSGRHDMPITGAIAGNTVKFVGSGLEFEMEVEGWQLVGRCRSPGDAASAACLLVKK